MYGIQPADSAIMSAREPCRLGSRPSPYVRVLIARGWANRSSGSAWDDSSRESRTVPRARPVVQAWHVIFLISGFFDSLFLADGGGEEQDDWLLG